MPKILILLAVVLAQLSTGYALDVPKLDRRVTDLAGLLTSDQTRALESKLQDLERTDSTQVAVLIIPSLEGEPLEDYSERVATAWRLGQKGRDNGALLLLAMKERKVRVEVGIRAGADPDRSQEPPYYPGRTGPALQIRTTTTAGSTPRLPQLFR